MSLVARHLGLDRPAGIGLDDICIHCEPGSLHAVLGANGAGKTSLMQLLSGERRPDRGEVLLDGADIHTHGSRQLARLRAVLPQHDTLSFGFPVRDVVGFGRMAWPDARHDAQSAAIDAALDEVGIADLATRSYTQLSGGERRRVQLARVLAQLAGTADQRGKLLILDEPTAHLDMHHQVATMEIARRCAEAGTAVIAVLHDPNLASRYADTVSLLAAGSIIASGPVNQCLNAENLGAIYGGLVRESRSVVGHPLYEFIDQRPQPRQAMD